MNLKTIALFFVLALSVLVAQPAAAFRYAETCNGSGIRWQNASIQFKVNSATVGGAAWQNSLETAQMGWNIHAPGSYWRIYYNWVPSMYHQLGNGDNEIDIAYTGELDPGFKALVRTKRTFCYAFPGAGSHYTEADILIASEVQGYDKSTNPVPSDHMQNTTLMLLHEHGHVLGLGHEDDVLATMNSNFPGPVGGPIGNNNEVQPLGDDARGARNAYGTSGTVRDVAASAVRLTSPGTSRTIPAPASTLRNAPVSFQFTILNRGTTDENIPVHFYLSSDRNVTPDDYFIGSTSIYLQYGRSITATANLTIPAYAPTGTQYIGWFTDPTNVIVAELNNVNNGVGLVNPTFIHTNRMPDACFTATPTSGSTPLNVSLNAGCSSDADGTGLTYTWDFGDGSGGTGQSTAHTYYYAGNFQIALTVTDPSGASSTAYRTISVSCGSFCPDEPY
ncbi:MAG TPA: PKD domain-containing protein [Thermoanaerobaculia bacterium]